MNNELRIMVRKQAIEDFLDELASSKPTPGGGATAALSGAMAAALVEMVAGLTIGKKRLEKKTRELKNLKIEADSFRKKLLNLADEDVEAYDRVVAAYKISREDKARKAEIREALKHATEIPLKTAQISNEVLKLAKKVVKKGNKNAVSDAKSAIHLAYAAKLSAVENVKINLKSIAGSQWRRKFEQAVARLK